MDEIFFMTHVITKSIEYCAGHRVYTQTSNDEFACGRHTKCRFVHGHQYKLNVILSRPELADDGMVTDFTNLKWLKNFIEDNIDHKFIFGKNDPWFKDDAAACTVPLKIPNTNHIVGYVANMNDYVKDTPEYEIMEGRVCVDFVPTSENLAKWYFDMVVPKMARLDHEVQVIAVELFETPTSKAVYAR